LIESVAASRQFPQTADAGMTVAEIAEFSCPNKRAARRYESGVYADEVLQRYFPPAMALINNIAAG